MWYIKLLEQHPESFKYRDLKANDLLFNEEDICNEIGIVIKGQLVISTITYLEKEETINIINENEVFGDLLLFSSNHLYLGNVTATKKSKVALINKNKLFKKKKVWRQVGLSWKTVECCCLQASPTILYFNK